MGGEKGMSLKNELNAMLKEEGCEIVGFAEIRSLSDDSRQGYDCGILMALPFTKRGLGYE